MKKRYKDVTDEERDEFIFELIPFIDANEAYYVDQFIRIKSGRKISWNWMAFLFAPFWCMYRKMYALGILNLLINELFVISNVSIFVKMVYYVIFAMFANFIYYKIIEERLHEKQKLAEVDRVKYQTKNGGTNIIAAVVWGIVSIIFSIVKSFIV